MEDIFRVESKNGKFYADVKVLSSLELLDLDVQENESQSFIAATEVANSVLDWNGNGFVNPLQLIGNKSNHKYIHLILRALDKKRGDIPELIVQELGNELIATDNKSEFKMKLKPLTVLELLDLITVERKKNIGELPSEIKIRLTANIVLDWNGEGKLTPLQLRERKELHNYVLSLDEGLNKFFLSEEFTISEPRRVLDGSSDNGEYEHNKPPTMEPEKSNGARLSFDVERVPQS